MEPLGIPGAWVFAPRIHSDDRGSFLELFRDAEFSGAVGHRLDVAQANCSVSRRGVIRGIHFADVPPGQAKYVMCLSGEIIDVVVDLRTGSPGFGRWEAVSLDAEARRAVYLAEGLGHAFMALTDRATVVYLSTACIPSIRPSGLPGRLEWNRSCRRRMPPRPPWPRPSGPGCSPATGRAGNMRPAGPSRPATDRDKAGFGRPVRRRRPRGGHGAAAAASRGLV